MKRKSNIIIIYAVGNICAKGCKPNCKGRRIYMCILKLNKLGVWTLNSCLAKTHETKTLIVSYKMQPGHRTLPPRSRNENTGRPFSIRAFERFEERSTPICLVSRVSNYSSHSPSIFGNYIYTNCLITTSLDDSDNVIVKLLVSTKNWPHAGTTTHNPIKSCRTLIGLAP